jgi:hypothetical protein
MKKHALLNYSVNFIAGLALLLCCTTPAIAQNEKTRSLEKAFEGKSALWAAHRYGSLSLKKGEGSQMKVVLNIRAEGNNAAEVQAFIERFTLEATEAGDNKVDIKTNSEIKTWNTINGRSTIKFKDGTSYSGIKNFKMHLDIYAPRLRYATLENAYDEILVQDGITDLLEIKIYEGKLQAPGNYEELRVDAKYSNGQVGNFKRCNAVLYESKIDFGSGGDLMLDAKYSRFQVGDLQALNLNSFEDKLRIGAVNGLVKMDDKYSEFVFLGNVGKAELTLFETKIQGENIADIFVKDGKYSEMQFREVNSMHFNTSFENKVQLDKIGTLAARESKYSEFNIGGLWNALEFTSSFEDKVRVRSIGATFTGAQFEGKYSELQLPIPAGVPYDLEAEGKYCEIRYPRDAFESSYYREKDSEISIKGRTKGATNASPKVKVKAFEGAVRLE